MAQSTIKAVEDTGWIYPLGTTGDNAKVKYRKRNGVLYLIFASYPLPSTRSSTSIFTLREDCQVGTSTNFIVRTQDDNVANGWISTNGSVNINSSVKGTGVVAHLAYPLN